MTRDHAILATLAEGDKHTGSSFDDFLREEGILEDVNAVAKARVEAYLTEGANSAHLPICTPPEPTPDVFLHAWKT